MKVDHLEIFAEHTGCSLFQRFKKIIAPAVTKFLGIEAMNDKESGVFDDQYFHHCYAIYMKQTGNGKWLFKRQTKVGKLSKGRRGQEIIQDGSSQGY